jgi:PD-(D/E)XK endonuclease
VVRFPTQSVRANTAHVITRGYAGEADIFLVFCPETKRIYSVPVDEAPRRCMYLRVDRPANGQAQGVNWAKEYELPG